VAIVGDTGLGADVGGTGELDRHGDPGGVRVGLGVVHAGAQLVEPAQDLGVAAQEADDQDREQGDGDALEDDQREHDGLLGSEGQGAVLTGGPRR
jgi:hypothetical protein